jgi:MFS family permease
MALPAIFFTPTFRYVFILILGSFSLGFGIAYPSPALPRILTEFTLTPLQTSVFTAITPLAAVLGPFVTNPILRYGSRRLAAFVLGTLLIISWEFLLFADPDMPYLLHVHRTILGIAIGGISSLVPMYVMELSPPDLRSVYGSMHPFGLTFGMFVVNFAGIFLTWQLLGGLALAVAIIFSLGTLALPPPKPKPAIAATQNSKGTDGLFSQYLRQFLIGVALFTIQQLSGIDAVLTNLGSILMSESGPALASSAQSIAGLLGIPLMKQIGRKWAWAFSLFGSALAMFALAMSEHYNLGPTVGTVAAFLFLFFFCFGLGPIPWFLPPEMFPERLRATALSLLVSLNWILSATVVFVYPLAAERLGAVAIMNFFAIVLVAGGFFGIVTLK